MPTSDQIKRINTDPDGLDFESLKKQGIENVQRLCGDVWTDYNAHDPGVTILEQLCYGLTDLAYRSGFETQDYLAGENGEIDYQQQALFNPKDIFPSSPVTNADYQKVLYDAIPAIDNIWFEPVLDDEGTSRGLYAVFVKLNDHLSLADEALPNQSDRLTAIFEAMESLRKLSDKGGETLDQLGHCLDTRQEALRRRNNRVKKRALIAKFDVLLTQAIEVLAQLDANLSCLDSIWEKLDLIWSVLADDAGRLTETIQARLDDALSQFNEVMSQSTLFPQLVETLPELNAPLTKHDDLFFMLRQCLPKMETSLSSLDDSLRKLDAALSDIYDSLCEPVDAPELVAEDQREDIVKRRIKTFFADHRNLCEDIQSVEIIKTAPYFLVGEIEVKPANDLAKVYAEIFFKCAEYISSGIRVERYEAVLADEKNYEQIFSGPLTRRGYINDHFFETARESLSVVDLIAVINQIDGVKRVRNLSLMDQENKKHVAINCKPSEGLLPSLCFPQVGKPMQVLRLGFSESVRTTKKRKQSSHGKAAKNKDKVLLEATKLELEKLIFEHHAFRNNLPSFDQFIKLPKGQRRHLQDYTSIQNQFPAIYGINRYGVPTTASVAVKAKAKQLKAYLYPYEQLMANYLKNLQEMPRLFSQDAELKQSYFSQLLNNQNVPDIEKLYVGGTTQTQQLTAEIHSYYDNFGERRNRVLDTLLAMYGEEFPQQSLVHFNFYRQADNDHWLIEKKTNYLQHICEMSRDRAQGFNYLSSTENAFSLGNAEHVASIQSKVSILLGLDKPRHFQWMTDALVKRKSRVVPEEKLATQVEFVMTDEAAESVPALHDGRTPHKDLLPVKLPPFSDAVFKEGIDLKNYQLVRSDTDTVVCFKPMNDDRLWRLTSKKRFDEAAEYAHQFCHAMTQLNMESEGLHIVEHLLLRPYGDDVVSETLPETFYNFRVSVILPSWTARFSDDEFRRYAEETVQRNLPAHIYAEFFWLDFVYMRDFELRYKRWLKLLQQVNQGSDNTANVKKLNKASEKIISFLIKNKPLHECESWV